MSADEASPEQCCGYRWIQKTLRQAAWAPALVFCFYVIAAKGLDAYIRFPNLDIPTHFIGGMAFSYFVTCLIENAQVVVGKIPANIIKQLAFTSTGSMVVFWEFYEFIYDRIFGTHTQLGINDTLSDMFFGLLGAWVWVTFFGRGHRESGETR